MQSVTGRKSHAFAVPTSRQLASRVVGRMFLEGLKRDQMADYLAHHLHILGGNSEIPADDSSTRQAPDAPPPARAGAIEE